MKLLKDKVCLITGGTRGIGKGIIKKFVKHGSKIAFTYLNSKNKARKLEEELKSITLIKGYQFDVSDYNSSKEHINQIINDFGKIDILINNVGITKDNLLIRMNEDYWQSVLKTNLNSIFNITKFVISSMIKMRSGSIINISSIVGLKGNAGQCNYSASKSGIIGFSKSIALELSSRNIRCNVIAPGFINTEMTTKLNPIITKKWINSIPLKRIGSIEDIANACLFFATDLSSYITGEVLNVNGGMYT